MTAVVSPPSLQQLQRLAWNSEDGHDESSAVNVEDVSRIFLPKKILQRSNSSSSIASDSSTSTTISINPSTGTAPSEVSSVGFVGVGKGGRLSAPGTEKDQWSGPRKAKSVWPPNRPEGAFGGAAVAVAAAAGIGATNGRLAGGPGISGISGLNHPSSLPMQENLQNVHQAGGGRALPNGGGNEPQALLVLVPTNATFERKSISVPIFPDILRIGRQTNAKTVPTATNGYFDSKVLSRQHAEIWADRTGKVWIRDVKSSNGTFVNGNRLSPESRDSEPHELRENDSLELGIDIVSEDQKSIVHHKVSAKVEHAGFPSSAANVMDLTFVDLDPSASSGLLASMPNGAGSRVRLGSQASMSSNGSRFDPQSALRGGSAPFGVQRHANAFLSPVSIESVMRKLNTELRQARQQSQDLNRTNEFFNALLATGAGQDLPKAPASILPPEPVEAPSAPSVPVPLPQDQQSSPSLPPPITTASQSFANGFIPPPKLDHLSPFSAPPAPPPQLPLPEKPDAPRSAHVEPSSLSPFRRASVEPGQLANGKSEGIKQSSILSLVEELKAAKRELDMQGNRVKELEELLRHERKARETAEECARALSTKQSGVGPVQDQEKVLAAPFTPPEDDMSLLRANGHGEAEVDFADSSSDGDVVVVDLPAHEASESSRAQAKAKAVDAEVSMSLLQDRLERMVRDMEEAKEQLKLQRSRAEAAESERDNLYSMVQKIRQANSTATHAKSVSDPHKIMVASSRALTPSPGEEDNGDDISANAAKDSETDGAVRTGDRSMLADGKPPGLLESAKDEQIRELQASLRAALAKVQRHDQLGSQSAPYVSMIGVVILGVSAMLYLNGWQKTER